jgi:hypothetical protein
VYDLPVTVQGFRVELAPTPEQAVRLAEHAGLSRVVENFCLERVRAALDQREAERSYGIPEAELTDVPWTAPALEAMWRREHPRTFPVVHGVRPVVAGTQRSVPAAGGGFEELG